MRTFRVHRQPLAKTHRCPLRRCTLDAAFGVAETDAVSGVNFHNWPGHPLLEAIFQGKGRRNSAAGSCQLTVNAVAARDARKVESLILSDALPNFLTWLKVAARASEQHPTDVFRWSAKLVNGALLYYWYPDAP